MALSPLISYLKFLEVKVEVFIESKLSKDHIIIINFN